MYTIEDKNSNIKLYRHDTDKWTLTEVPNNLDLVLDLQKSIMLFDGNVAIASKHNSKPCSKTKICEPVVLYDVKSNKLIANNVEYKDLEANLIRLQEKDNEYFIIENTLYNGLINAFYNTIDSIVYDKKNLKIEYWYELNDKSIADTFSLDAYKIDKLLRKYTKSGLKNKPSTFAITPTKHLIWSTNQGFPTSADKWNGKKIPKELKRTVFYDSEKHIVKRGPDFMNSPIESYQISIDENKAIFIGGNENITGVLALTYTNATPYEYTQIIEVKK